MADLWNITKASVDSDGNLTLSGGIESSGGTVVLTGLPTSDPTVEGQVWSNSGVLTVSAG